MPLKNLIKTKGQNFLRVFFSLSVFFLILPAPFAFSLDLIYFASLEEQTLNGKTKSFSLYLNPVKKALTKDKFQYFYWNIITNNHTDKKQIIESGIRAFLLKNGKLSVESYSKKENFKINDAVSAYFEGYFKNNIKILKIENIENSAKKKVYLKGLYAPLSYPDSWNRIILMDKIKSEIKYFRTFFW
jgi:hypothetical protein